MYTDIDVNASYASWYIRRAISSGAFPWIVTVGAEAKSLGLKFAYHNHGYGLVPMEAQVPLELLL